MSRYFTMSARDSTLTVCYGWDPGLVSFFAWVGPNGGECDGDELVFNVGDAPAEIPTPEELGRLLRDSGHLVLAHEDVAQLRADMGREGATRRTPALQAFLDGMAP